jgi:hypothetical protein
MDDLGIFIDNVEELLLPKLANGNQSLFFV